MNTANHTEFQSTLPREERLVSSSFVTVSIYFNPRSHERSDSVAQGTLHPHKDFNPRSHERSDCQLLLQAQIQFLFQSTLPREERQGLANRQGNTGGDFNPRSHERSDKSKKYLISSIRVISIHAPTRGATKQWQRKCMVKRFQSTLPREERHRT